MRRTSQAARRRPPRARLISDFTICLMSVIPLTLTISLCLVFIFVIFFWRESSRRRYSSAERDALLPLADEAARLATSPHERVSRPRVEPADRSTSAAAVRHS